MREELSMELQGLSATVTGAGRGIGRGIALKLAEAGADVVIGDLDPSNAESVAAEARALGRRSLAVEADVGTRAGANRLIAAAKDEMGKIDILVNNAGVVGAPGWQSRSQPSDEDWEAVLRVNLMSRVFCSEAAAEHMIERGFGKIVNIASIGGIQGSPMLTHYCVSKAADINYTQGLALKLGRHGINVNAILPGLLMTDMMSGIYDIGRVRGETPEELGDAEIYSRAVSRVPMGRGQTPEDIGDLVVFLCSERARNIHAQSINVDGGYRIR